MARPGSTTVPRTGGRRPGRRRRGWRRLVPTWRGLLVAGSVLVLLGVGLFAVGYARATIPEANEFATAQTTVVYFSDGTTEMGRFAAQDRTIVGLESIPPHVRNAVIAAEDRGFYQNNGVSPRGIVRAFVGNVFGDGGNLQGGSTITQQYVKNYYLEPERTLTRKVNEAFISIKIDRQLSKDEILTDYLNTIFFGRGAYGIEAASRAYFGKGVADLTVAEGALLAGVIPSPARFDPAVDPEAAQRRLDYVLDGMVSEGLVTQGERDAQTMPPTIEQAPGNALGGPTGYLLTTVRAEVRQRLGVSDDQIDRGGYRIVSTFDARLQAAAVAAVDAGLPPAAERPAGTRVGLVSIDPATGAVRAMYGGADFVSDGHNNNATQAIAQDGSTFKPFALVAGLENGISLRSRYSGRSGQDLDGFEVDNFGDEDFGRIDLVEATADSVNTVFVQLNQEVGPERTVEVAVRAGLPADTPDLQPFPSNVLGPSSNTVAEMANAYATFAAQGVRAERYTVQSVTQPDEGELFVAAPAPERVFAADVMADTTFALQQVVESGSGRAARALDRPVAGKTGTSSENRSAWFVGFTPQLSTAVALFRTGEDGSTAIPLEPFGGVRQVTGGTLPADVWTAYMQVALDGVEVLDFPPRADVGRRPEPSRTSSPRPAPTSEEPSVEPTDTAEPPPPSPEPTDTAEPPPEPRPTQSDPGQPAPTVTEALPTPPVPPDDGTGG